MNIYQVRDLAVKMLGLYYIVTAINYLPQLLSLFTLSTKAKEYIAPMSVFIIASILPVVLYFIVAYILLFKSALVLRILWPREDEVPSTPVTLSLATGVSLIGLFYLIGSLGGLSVELYMLGFKREMWGSYIQYKYLPNIFTSVFSVICIIKSQTIAEYIKRKVG